MLTKLIIDELEKRQAPLGPDTTAELTIDECLALDADQQKVVGTLKTLETLRKILIVKDANSKCGIHSVMLLRVVRGR